VSRALAGLVGGLLATALVAVGSPAVTTLAGADRPTSPQMVGITNDVEDLERTSDGRLVVLERVGETLRSEGDLAVVLVYDRWDQLDERHAITNETVPANRTANLVGVARAGSGGWWLVAANGTAYRFTEGWAYAGETRSLPGDVRAVDRAPNGAVWVATTDGLRAYGPGLSTVRSERPWAADPPYVAGLEVDRSDVWVMAEGELWRFGRRGEGTLRSPVARQTFHGPTEARSDLEPAPDGDWHVLGGGGSVNRVTGTLVFTGATHDVGTDRAYPGTPSDVLMFPPPWMLLWLAGALPVAFLLAAALAVGKWRDHDRLGYAVAAAASPLLLLAIYTSPWPLRPMLFALPVPDTLVALATLLAVGGHVGALSTVEDAGPGISTTVVAYVPLLVSALVLLGKLLGLV
jgi:hypothetical protein